jgi:hypothetical protein
MQEIQIKEASQNTNATAITCVATMAKKQSTLLNEGAHWDQLNGKVA